jgi:hypothetical protein
MIGGAIRHNIALEPNRDDLFAKYNNDLAHIYNMSHAHHPVTQWVAASPEHISWTLAHAISLINVMGEFGYNYSRYDPQASCATYLLREIWLLDPSAAARDLDHQNSAAHGNFGLNFKHLTEVTEAYQLYAIERWKLDCLRTRKNAIRFAWATPQFLRERDPEFASLLAQTDEYKHPLDREHPLMSYCHSTSKAGADTLALYWGKLPSRERATQHRMKLPISK